MFRSASFATLFISLVFGNISAQSVNKIHRKAIVVDTHNDILMRAVDLGVVFDTDLSGKTHSDLDRWNKGGLDVQVFSVFCDGDHKDPYAYAIRSLDTLDAIVKRNPAKIELVSDHKGLMKAVRNHKIAAMAGVEGGHMIENSLDKLDTFYRRGARYLSLTHNIAPSWATSAADETSGKELPFKGLNEFGKQVVQRMNKLGMLIDVSHSGDKTFWDVIALTQKPIIASHSSVYTLVHSRRNLKDDQILAIKKNGGVIQVNFNPGFVDSTFDKRESIFLQKHKTEIDSLVAKGMQEYYAIDQLYYMYATEASAIRPPLSLVIDHIDYIAKLAGVDYVGLGSDFDGINTTPLQLDDVTSYPLITKALIGRGYSRRDIKKILGGNFLRVLKANE
ncbi:MAG: membrane dipeptidase [Chitinophagaceae bacterium]|nr:MAG: membrane dipeptidase [Chitinophagaceae bacterium]